MRPNSQSAVPSLMSISQFLEFCDGRPDGERWELIEGIAVMNASPVGIHQLICGNIVGLLREAKIATNAAWIPLLGIGTRVPLSPNSLPQPDVYVQEGPATHSAETDDAIVLFEVLSKSNTPRDQDWRRQVYASIPNCQHYVTVATKSVIATRYDRASGWKGMQVKGLAGSLALPAIGVTLPLSGIYSWTPFA